MKKPSVNIFWFRRDLRLEDNRTLFECLSSEYKCLPIFIFDINILNKTADKKDTRVSFIYNELDKINNNLNKYNSGVKVLYTTPETAFKQLSKDYSIKSVFCNKDYDPYSRKRDSEILEQLKIEKIEFKSFKDHVIFEENEVLKDDNTPYTVYTPYSKKWKKNLTEINFSHYKSENCCDNFYEFRNRFPKINEIGFNKNDIKIPDTEANKQTILNYHTSRDLPYIKNGTSKLGVHLRFGTISVRQLAKKAMTLNETFLNELIWRDFFHQIIYHFPKSVNQEFKTKYSFIPWQNNMDNFDSWCDGKTGIPIVDAGMRELNLTGHMHNRVRMIVASFLCKNLLIHWKLGERYFATKLLDYDLASNVGNWQWAAGCGCDAAPYFRVFNPITQQQKFDPNFEYVKKWVPEYQSNEYKKSAIVDLKESRSRAIETYKKALANA